MTHGFGGWGPNVQAWASRDAPTVVLKYENLLVHPVGAVKAALGGLPIKVPAPGGARVVPPFADLRQQLPQFFRRGSPGAWRDEMPSDLEHLFWEKYGDIMSAMDYSRN